MSEETSADTATVLVNGISGASTKMDVSPNNSTTTISTTGDGAPDADAIKMFVGQIPRGWTETELRKLFEEFGPVYQLSVLRDKATGESRGCCFVTFYHRKDAIASQGALHNVKVLPGMHHPVQMKPADSENRNDRKLFIGMINKKSNESEVKTMFASFGLIEDCTVLRDSAGASKGCAFVTFSSRASALNAIKAMHHSKTMEGCSMPLVVKLADTQKDKDQKKHPVVSGGGLGLISGAHHQPSLVGASPAAGCLFPFAAAAQNAAAANPAAALHHQHSNMLSGGGSSMLGLLQNLQGLNAANGALATGYPLMANMNTSTSSAAGSVNSMGGYYGLNSQLAAANNGPSPVNSNMAALINYLLTAAAVSSAAPGSANVTGNLAALQSASLLNSMPQGWKHASSSTSPPAFNGNLIHLTGAGGLPASYLPPHAYATGGSIPSAGAPGATAGNSGGGGNSMKQLEGPEGANLFIYHLPQEFTDADLAQTFAPFGALLSAKVFVDKQTNLSKCFGFVSFESAASAQTAINSMNGFQIGTKRLKVQLKRSKQEAKPYQHPQQQTDSGSTKA